MPTVSKPAAPVLDEENWGDFSQGGVQGGVQAKSGFEDNDVFGNVWK